VVLAVIIFTDQFMSFLWPLIATTSDELQVLTVGVAALRSHGGANYGLWSALRRHVADSRSEFSSSSCSDNSSPVSCRRLETVRMPVSETRSNTAPAIELIEVGKSYGKVNVLNGVNLSIAPGEFIALLGPFRLREEHAAETDCTGSRR